MQVVTFGEALFRVATNAGERLSHANRLNFYLGGTELNVAANLKSLGLQSAFVSALPAGPTGELIKEKVERLGIDVRYCIGLGDSEIGWYLMELGSPPRADFVFHRTASAMAKQPGFAFDWDKIFTGNTLFHCSGVTAGLSEVLTHEVKKAQTIAKQKGLLVSYDLNYRKNIWSLNEFVKRQQDIFNHIDWLFCSRADLKLFFGEDFEHHHFKNVFLNSNLSLLILTQRSLDNREYGIEVISKQEKIISKKYPINCIDRIGVGDSATAGFIKAYLTTNNLALGCEWAALAGALKYGICGDMALLKENEITRILAPSPHSGIIR